MKKRRARAHLSVPEYWNAWSQVPGWFAAADVHVFDVLLQSQETAGDSGDLLEIGAYAGKSAILLGKHAQAGEQVIVCDLFEDEAPGADNAVENLKSYANLSRRSFDTNCRRFLDSVPVVYQQDSRSLQEHLRPKSCRFVHVDGSHLWEIAAVDTQTAINSVTTHGWMAFDDFRSQHTPGVAAAVWSAASSGDLIPAIVTAAKLYARPSAARHLDVDTLGAQLDSMGYGVETQRILGTTVLRVQGGPDDLLYGDPKWWHGWVPPKALDKARSWRAKSVSQAQPV